MEANILGYLLDALDPDAKREVEAYLDKDPGARHQLETLRRALQPLAADKEEFEPPPQLALRTLARVAEYRCRPLPPAPAPSPARVIGMGARWWRRADVLVAASLMIVVGGVGVPGVMHIRAEHQKAACASNLNLFREALFSYADKNNGEFPVIRKDEPRHVAGSFAPMLQEAGVLPEGCSVRCPANGHGANEVPTTEQLNGLTDEEFAERARRLSSCYAYSLGYIDESQEHCGPPPRDQKQLNSGLIPILADCPSVGPNNERGNSPNHGGGQNVLYCDGHVSFSKTPHAGVDNDHIYLNQKGKVAAGVNRWDTVLGCRDDRP